MILSEHLPGAFSLSDHLDARSADALSSVAPLLERSLPLEEPQPSAAARARADKARAEREQRLAAALEQALPLIESSGYDIQVLVVLLRLRVESGGLEGVLDALDVLGRMLGDAWASLPASLAGRSEREQEKQQRKWARYIDAALEQMYSWLARERERDEHALAAGFAASAERWGAALASIERGLGSTTLPVARFDAVDRGVRALARAGDATATRSGSVRPGPGGTLDGAARAGTSVASSSDATREGPTWESPTWEGATASDTASSRANSGGAIPRAANDGATSASAYEADMSNDGANPGEPSSNRANAGTSATPPREGASTLELRVSPRFWELEQRLAAFDTLLARGEYEKAGIVESDLRETLEHFDVAAYFPALFARYFEGCAAHGEHLARHEPDRGELRASALTRLYRTDLERFLALPDPTSRS